jgi:4-carboxymuconolactone decarboxylase
MEWEEGRNVDAQRVERGEAARERVLGRDALAQLIAPSDSFNADFQRIITEYCWGEVWTRDALSDQDRALINISALAVMNRSGEFRAHVGAALRNGLSLERLRDALIQITVYAGVPVGVEAFRNAREVLRELGIVPEPVTQSAPDGRVETTEGGR